MPSTSTSTPRDLGGGLILRRATRADADAVAHFNAIVQRDPDSPEPEETEAAWAYDLFRENHPTFRLEDFTIVEDTAAGQIVSVSNLIPQTWTYGGIPFGVGRPELVGTLPEYRHRGLVRAQFEVLHAWSAAAGHKLQAITGIPFFYRQFGYEMAMDLDGGRQGPVQNVTPLKAGVQEAFTCRPVDEADLPFIMRTEQEASRRLLVACVRDEALWRYEIFGKSERNLTRLEWRIVQMASGEPVGYLGHEARLQRKRLLLRVCELQAGVSWLAAAPGILRYLKSAGESYAQHNAAAFDAICAAFGPVHSMYEAVQNQLPQVRRSYAWYLRVPDLPDFLRHIAAVLDERLARSAAAGHAGELKLSFYRSGVRLQFEAGRLAAVEPWRPSHEEPGIAGFPGLTFLQLLFGYRTLDELRYAFADCWVDGDEATGLLNALFPKQPSFVWPVS